MSIEGNERVIYFIPVARTPTEAQALEIVRSENHSLVIGSGTTEKRVPVYDPNTGDLLGYNIIEVDLSGQTIQAIIVTLSNGHTLLR